MRARILPGPPGGSNREMRANDPIAVTRAGVLEAPSQLVTVALMSRWSCSWALVLLVGCSDDGVPADTNSPVTGGSAGTSDGLTTGASTSDTNDTAPQTTGTTDPTDPTIGGTTTTGNATSGDETSGGQTPDGETRIYVAGGNAVSVWAADEVGALTEVQQLDQGGNVGPLAHRDSQMLYAARLDADAIAALEIDPVTGMLSEVGVTTVGHRPVYITLDNGGSWLLSADFGDDLVEVRPLEANGTVGNTPSQSLTVQQRPHAVVFDPAGTHVFVPHRDSNLVEQYVFDDVTGTLTPNDPPSVLAPSGAGPRHIAFAPDESAAYVVNEFSSSVTVYAYDAASGLLTQGDTVSALPPDFQDENTGADIHVTPDGAYVYASMRGHDSLAVFTASPLTYQTNVPTEARPREFGLDPFGRFLYAAGQDSGMLAGYTVEADGSLTPGAVYNVGANAQWVLGVELPAQ